MKQFRYQDINVGDTVKLKDGTEWTITYKTPTNKKMRNRYGFFNFLAEIDETGKDKKRFWAGKSEDIIYLKDVVEIVS